MPLKQILRNILLAILIAQFLILLLAEIFGIFVIHEGSYLLYVFKNELTIQSLTFVPWFGLSVIIGNLFGYSFPDPSEHRAYLLPIIPWLVVVALVYFILSSFSLKKVAAK